MARGVIALTIHSFVDLYSSQRNYQALGANAHS
jgi:hypothetical protein